MDGNKKRFFNRHPTQLPQKDQEKTRKLLQSFFAGGLVADKHQFIVVFGGGEKPLEGEATIGR